MLASAGIGWTSELGRSGDQFISKVSDVISEILASQANYSDIKSDLQTFLDKEMKRTSKLEERLVASETGGLRSKKCKLVSAQMINKEMDNKKLTAPIINFLIGPWYDSIQLLALKDRFDSETWLRAVKMTETIIWTYQPIETNDVEKANAQRQRLYGVIEHIPAEIRELLVSLEHNALKIQAALEDIESEHVLVISEQELDYTEITKIKIADDALRQKVSVSKVLLRKLNKLEPGQWFTFEENKQSIRIKLILKLDDITTVLFTNRNGMKSLEKSFDDLAYYLSAGIIKPLNLDDIFSSTYRSYYQGLVDTYERARVCSRSRASGDLRDGSQGQGNSGSCA